MNGRRNVNGQSGFSLFELLVVLCILGILCGVAYNRLNVKETTASAWGVVNESAYQAAKSALAKALAQDPENPPTLEDLRNKIDSKRTIYVTNCSNASTSTSPTTFGTRCLAIDINGDRVANAGEVFASAYTDGDCQAPLFDESSQRVCCLERPYWDPSFGTPLPVANNIGDTF